MCFAPHELGLVLACGSSDGSISILSSTGTYIEIGIHIHYKLIYQNIIQEQSWLMFSVQNYFLNFIWLEEHVLLMAGQCLQVFLIHK